MQRILPRFLKPKIRQQIIFIGMISIFIPLFIVGLFSIIQARNQMSNQYEEQISAASLRINSTLFDITTSLYTSSDSLINSTYIRSLLGSNFSEPMDLQSYELVTDLLTTMHSTTAAISSITIYTNNPNIPSNSYISSVNDNYANQPWNKDIKGKTINSWQCLTRKDSWNNDVYDLSLVRRLGVNSTTYSAYLVLSIDSNYLKNRLLNSDYFVLASVDNGPAFYSSEKSWIQKKIPFPSDFDNNYYKYTGLMDFNSKKQLTTIVTFLPYKTYNKFYICLSDPNAYNNLNHITFIYIFILIISTVLPLFLIVLFSSYFNGRIQILKNTMHQVSLGDYKDMKTFNGDDELAVIFKDLKSTVKRISENEARFYQSQIAEQQLINKQQHMEFKMLASQINPHFLYNTLETIRMQALSTGDMNVVKSIKLLGESMHYVLENTGTDSTTLYKEIEYVKVYLAIQQLRFGDRINYTISYPDNMDLNHFKILPLLLQPIVENAVIHGLERTSQNGQILISILNNTQNILTIKVSDNGYGMDDEKLSELNLRINSQSLDSTTSIGLYNINQRIKLLYGDEFGIYFTSRLNEGTTVTLNIPGIVPKEA